MAQFEPAQVDTGQLILTYLYVLIVLPVAGKDIVLFPSTVQAEHVHTVANSV